MDRAVGCMILGRVASNLQHALLNFDRNIVWCSNRKRRLPGPEGRKECPWVLGGDRQAPMKLSRSMTPGRDISQKETGDDGKNVCFLY